MENVELPVDDTVDPRFRAMFPFKRFNRMQSRAVPVILGSDNNMVVAAPTASGKTVLAEAAMTRELGRADKGKVLFIAPLRALTSEKESEWKQTLGSLGLKVYVVTGERELSPYEAKASDVIITTPEKWDSATRKYLMERYSFVKDVTLLIVDEVHLLDSDSRGGTLEAVISRMRRIKEGKRLRLLALSATMPNIAEVARWIGAEGEDVLMFDGSYRPVQLETAVIPYYPKDNDFLNRYIRLYKAFDLIRKALEGGHQGLIFVASRQDTYQSSEKLCEILKKERTYFLLPQDERRLQEIKGRVSSQPLKSCIAAGVAFHHAGLSMQDRALVENGFREGVIKVLVSTSTLAWGVNLPARTVVVRDIEIYDPIEGMKDMSSIDLLQMLGRAGRPGYDTKGNGYVIAPHTRARELERLIREGKEIESTLKHSLPEHLNAEIAVRMVRSPQEAVEWLKTTFFYVRIGGKDVESLAKKELDALIKKGFVNDVDGILLPTPSGSIASDFYIRLETALLFREVARKGSLDTEGVLDAVAKASEFSQVVTRPGEAGALKQFNGMPGGSAKVRAILLAYMKGKVPDELKADAWAIKQNASRLLGALSAFCSEYSGETLSKKVRMVSLQIDKGIPEEALSLASIPGAGERTIDALMKAGIRSPRDAADKRPEDLIRMGVRPALAIEIVDMAKNLPSLDCDLSKVPGCLPPGEAEASVTLKNNGGAGTVSVAIDGGTKERLYLGKGASKTLAFSVEMGEKDKEVRITAEYPDAMLPADVWRATIKAQKEDTINMAQGKYYIIAGNANVEFKGRTEERYSGRSVVLVKPDSTIVVHADTGVKPRNYISRASDLKMTKETDGGISIVAGSGGETLSIAFTDVKLMESPFGEQAVTEVQAPAGEDDPKLEKALRALRTSLAKEKSVPPYVIFKDDTMRDIIAKKPKNKEELLAVNGIGPAKAEQYGDMILAAVLDQRADQEVKPE